MLARRVSRTALAGGVLASALALAAPATQADEPGQTAPVVFRLAGADRIETAVEISRSLWKTPEVPEDNRAEALAVVLTRSDTFADALSAGPLAANKTGPLLLTPSAHLDQRTRAELDRVLVSGGRVYIVGGTSAVSAAVENELRSEGYAVYRRAGANRYETSVRVAEYMGHEPAALFFATGNNYPDALVASAIAGAFRVPVLVTDGTRLRTVTRDYMAKHDAGVYWVAVGGPAVTAVPGENDGFVGSDRYDTAVQVARFYWPPNDPDVAPLNIGLATGENFPDALAGGALMGAIASPLLLTPTATLDPGTRAYLSESKDTIMVGVIFGGPAAVSQAVEEEVRATIGATVPGQTRPGDRSSVDVGSWLLSAAHVPGSLASR